MSHDTPPTAAAAPSDARPPVWYWIVSGLALLWNLVGVLAFLGQIMLTEESLTKLPVEQQALYRDIPGWVTLAFACAVFAGTFGCVGLLLRKKWALPVLCVSLAGALAQNTHYFFLSDIVAVLGTQAVVMPLVVIAIGIGLIGLARWGVARGWLR